MIIKILYLRKSGGRFPGVAYNTSKAEQGKGELMKVANFGVLQGLSNLRPQDYVNYLKAISAANSRVKKPQFHAVISGKGQLYDKHSLTTIAGQWLKEMGYGDQPYLITFHKDTDNNHVHIVTTRVDREGRKIDSAYEKIRAQLAMSKVLGYDYAMQYRFSTHAQFMLLLEQAGLPGKDPNVHQIEKKIAGYRADPTQIAALKAILLSYRNDPLFQEKLKSLHGVELILHAAEGKAPYGYTIIDHAHLAVYKGSEVLPLKQLLANQPLTGIAVTVLVERTVSDNAVATGVHIQSIWIADDVDDQQIHGMRRRRQQKARTNTR